MPLDHSSSFSVSNGTRNGNNLSPEFSEQEVVRILLQTLRDHGYELVFIFPGIPVGCR